MNIHEYQAKELLKKYGVAVLAGFPAMTVDEAVAGAEKLGGPYRAASRPSTLTRPWQPPRNWAVRSGWSRRKFTPAVAARAAGSRW